MIIISTGKVDIEVKEIGYGDHELWTDRLFSQLMPLGSCSKHSNNDRKKQQYILKVSLLYTLANHCGLRVIRWFHLWLNLLHISRD